MRDDRPLAAELHCYIPAELDETWAQLRHLGRRRAQLLLGWQLTVHPDGTSQVRSLAGKTIRSHSPPPRPG